MLAERPKDGEQLRVSGNRNKGLPSDLEGADVDTRSSVLWPERDGEERRGQGEGWLWEDGDVVGEDQETRRGEQSLVRWSRVGCRSTQRGALRIRDRGARSTVYLKMHFDVSDGVTVDLGLGEDERLKSRALGGCDVIL